MEREAEAKDGPPAPATKATNGRAASIVGGGRAEEEEEEVVGWQSAPAPSAPSARPSLSSSSSRSSSHDCWSRALSCTAVASPCCHASNSRCWACARWRSALGRGCVHMMQCWSTPPPAPSRAVLRNVHEGQDHRSSGTGGGRGRDGVVGVVVGVALLRGRTLNGSSSACMAQGRRVFRGRVTSCEEAILKLCRAEGLRSTNSGSTWRRSGGGYYIMLADECITWCG